MKIALIGQKGIPSQGGGVERYTEEVAVRLAKNGHEVLCYCRPCYSGGMKEYRGVKLLTSPTIKSKNFEAITATITSALKARFQDPDMIILHSIGPALALPFLKLLFPRIPIVSIFQSQDYEHAKWGSLARWMLLLGAWFSTHFATECYTVSGDIQKFAWEKLGRYIGIIPNGISLAEITSRRTKGIGAPRLVVVSRLIPHKRVEDIIQAVKQLSFEVKLDIYGAEPKGVNGYKQKLLDLIGSHKNIVLHGNQPSEVVNRALLNSDMFVHASENEGASLAVLEALGKHLPLVLSDIPSHRELDQDGVWLFEVGNIAQIKSCISTAVNSVKKPSPAKWQNWNIIVSQIESFELAK